MNPGSTTTSLTPLRDNGEYVVSRLPINVSTLPCSADARTRADASGLEFSESMSCPGGGLETRCAVQLNADVPVGHDDDRIGRPAENSDD